MYDLLINANTSNDLRIQSGDALLINPVQSRIKIWGKVNRPAIYEVLEGETFEDVLTFASGFSSGADKNKITLSRMNDLGQREFKDLSYDDLKSVKLSDLDEVFVHDLSGKYTNNIRIEGFINNKGIYSAKERNTLEDFINENDLLDSTYLPFSVISRKDKDGSREYITSDLNSSTRKEFELFPNDEVFVFSEYDIDFINSALLADALNLLSEDDKNSLDDFYKIQKQLTIESNNIAQERTLSTSQVSKVIKGLLL